MSKSDTPKVAPGLIEATKPARPHPRVRCDTGRYHRRYVDSVGRPMTGAVTITRRGAHVGGAVVTTGPGRVELVDGHLDVQLAPGEYDLTAQLRTADAVGAVHRDTVTITGA